MITYFNALVLGALQGLTELFPISSLGHSVLLPHILGWNIAEGDNYFLIFIVATHLATALVLLGFYWSDWVLVVKGIFSSLKNRVVSSNNEYEKMGWMLVVGTIPAGVLGVLFEEKVKLIFSSPSYVAFFLLLNGVLLYGAEILRKKAKNKETENASDKRIARLSWVQTVKIGCAQTLALIPGFSRTGATLAGGLIVGLNHKDAARFSFMLATPIIFAASLLKLPELIGSNRYELGPIIFGAIISGVTAFIAVRFMTKYFETKTLKPFALYCVIVGLILSLAFLF